ncbi:bifunctional diguanylate cyclase/phosphodiesterase [Novosphingobium sp. TH158]|uniref:putative bifunctional diguanylate cyclase/phosphodiesterase n=1 Tax=Novosphingobium sp. TH158 TaxID=2067455 RepID=UPI000C7D1336|nr:EAL domain-containing protein [Novosphingobium sp. TH158]PLK25705.1 GGDEF-domain containing protein [Novosphingobium sp. TH158]
MIAHSSGNRGVGDHAGAGAGRNSDAKKQLERTGRDVVVLAISFVALVLFVGTGGTVIPQAIRWLQGIGLPPDRVLSNALLLNIALIIFGWRRYRDLTDQVQERSRAEERARLLAETDPLTGCLNRRSVCAAIEELRNAAGRRGEQVAVLVFDLDNFKRLNDCNGHAAGDAVLRESARRLQAVLPQGSLTARLGGDEFACAIPFDPARPEVVERIAAQLLETLSAPVESAGVKLEGLSISLGLARFDIATGKAVTAQDLLHMADIAMYHAKKAGKDRYFWFEPQMESELRFRSELEAGIRHGVAHGEFVPFYEPQVDLKTGTISGFEMLARWQSPELGLVGPDLFIPIAEEIGVIGDLSESVIRQALQDAKEWDPALSLSVNISPVQLRDPWFAQKLLKLLVEANFPANRLEIEITESCLHENLGLVRSLIVSLKNQGVRISLDDFGTGYSSLAQLRSLPFDRIKIDRSFISTLASNSDSMTIVQAIASLGSGLGLPITAEGVEDSEVVDELRRMGEFKAQGYLYGRPAAAPDIEKRLAELGLLRKAQTLAFPSPTNAEQRAGTA